MANVLEITKENFESEVLKADGIVILKFGAEWCGPCKKMDPIIDQVATENPDVKITHLDIDKEREIPVQYAVLSVPTTLFFKDGEVKDTIVGLVPKAKIEEKIEGLK